EAHVDAAFSPELSLELLDSPRDLVVPAAAGQLDDRPRPPDLCRVEALALPETSEVVGDVGLQERDCVPQFAQAVEEVEICPVAVAADLWCGLGGRECGSRDADLDGLDRAQRRAEHADVPPAGCRGAVGKLRRFGEE